jgi:cytoplasmic FMR1 interacting protein
MQITLEAVIKRSPHFDEKVWNVGETSKPIEYEIIYHLEYTRQAHNDYLAKFMSTIAEVRAVLSREGYKGIQPPLAKDVTATVLQGFQLLSDWSAKILQQSAWKYSKPNTDPSIESQVDYERVRIK